MDRKDWADGLMGDDPSDDSPQNETEREMSREDESIVDLVDLVDDDRVERSSVDDDLIRQQVAEKVERIARELFPPIAERIIREEIDKLKRET